MAALALHLFEEIPSVGDRVTAGTLLPEQNVEMEILAMDGHRIEQIRLSKPSQTASSPIAS